MTCGNSDKPSSVSWTRPVRSMRERSCLRRPPEDGLVDPVGLADELLPQTEGLEHLDRAAGDAVGLPHLERAVAALDQPRADAGEVRQLCGQQGPGRPAADDENVHGIGQLRLANVGVAGRVAIQVELHVASVIGRTDQIRRNADCKVPARCGLGRQAGAPRPRVSTSASPAASRPQASASGACAAVTPLRTGIGESTMRTQHFEATERAMQCVQWHWQLGLR